MKKEWRFMSSIALMVIFTSCGPVLYQPNTVRAPELNDSTNGEVSLNVGLSGTELQLGQKITQSCYVHSHGVISGYRTRLGAGVGFLAHKPRRNPIFRSSILNKGYIGPLTAFIQFSVNRQINLSNPSHTRSVDAFLADTDIPSFTSDYNLYSFGVHGGSVSKRESKSYFIETCFIPVLNEHYSLFDLQRAEPELDLWSKSYTNVMFTIIGWQYQRNFRYAHYALGIKVAIPHNEYNFYHYLHRELVYVRIGIDLQWRKKAR